MQIQLFVLLLCWYGLVTKASCGIDFYWFSVFSVLVWSLASFQFSSFHLFSEIKSRVLCFMFYVCRRVVKLAFNCFSSGWLFLFPGCFHCSIFFRVLTKK